MFTITTGRTTNGWLQDLKVDKIILVVATRKKIKKPHIDKIDYEPNINIVTFLWLRE
jgi:hypothetical protein